MNRFIVGLAGLAIATSTASAAFLGLSIREDKALDPAANLPPGLRTFNLYAMFSGSGTAGGAGRINTVISVGQPNLQAGFGINLTSNPGANFFQATAGQGGTNVGGLNWEVAARTKYDTFMSIGVKYIDPDETSDGLYPTADNSSADPDFGYFNTDGIAGTAALGLNLGHDTIRGGWFNASPPSLQGAAVADGTGAFKAFLGQFSIAGVVAGNAIGGMVGAGVFESDIFAGQLTIYTQAEGQGTDANLITFRKIPTPGAAALFGLAGLAGLRRRR